MPSKKSNKAQAALEYLITYGWALIAIATIIGVLVFAAGGGVNTNTCTTFLTIICKGIGVDGDTLVMVLQNSTGQKISINPFSDICFDGACGYGRIKFNETTYRFETVELPTGAEFTVFGEGQVLANEMSITYVEGQTGLEKTVTSTMGTEAPDDIALSNDGTDIGQPAGQVDCIDAGMTDCYYVVEATGVIPTNITAGGQTISFGTLRGVTNIEITDNLRAGQAALAFYVEEPVPSGTMPQINFDIYTGLVPIQNIKQGWNVVEVDMLAPTFMFGGNILDFTLSSQNSDFTINNTDNSPKAVLVINSLA